MPVRLEQSTHFRPTMTELKIPESVGLSGAPKKVAELDKIQKQLPQEPSVNVWRLVDSRAAPPSRARRLDGQNHMISEVRGESQGSLTSFKGSAAQPAQPCALLGSGENLEFGLRTVDEKSVRRMGVGPCQCGCRCLHRACCLHALSPLCS